MPSSSQDSPGTTLQGVNLLAYILVGVLACGLALPYLHAWAWCLADVRREHMLDSSARAQWFGALLLLSVVAIPLYVSGPGRERCDPRSLWWPWKR